MYRCNECIHAEQETTDDVAYCNCCENGNFFQEYKDEYILLNVGEVWW